MLVDLHYGWGGLAEPSSQLKALMEAEDNEIQVRRGPPLRAVLCVVFSAPSSALRCVRSVHDGRVGWCG